MTTWNPRANELFLKALELRSAGERQEYLDGACGGDTALRAEVDSLLEASGRVGLFLESPAAIVSSPLGGEGQGVREIATVDEPISAGPGTVLGPYKVLEQIGEGGFGVVFMAEQREPIRRKVALKVLKPGMESRQVIARFEAERQALALMDHPNIAKVLDAGQASNGRPYFVMDLVKGLPITDYCDEAQLTTRERLELFVHVCQAVQHAHQKGIIHRDIKPSNVLVTVQDGAALVKVIDFGIAKAVGQQLTDKTVFTGFAQMIGTPLYMSPEQAALSNTDVDTRSDIYSLGVLLYELLTGTTPFLRERLQQAGYDEMRRILREEEPPRPSTRISTLGQAARTVSTNRKSDPQRLSRLCRGELDWIVMKALEKDRNRRYETASAFAADVQGYLHDEPVHACPPSASYRLRKFVRRNKGPVLATSVFLLLLVTGGAGTAVGLVRALEAEGQALADRDQKDVALRQVVAERDQKEQALQKAVQARQQAREALVTLTDDVVTELLGRQAQLTAQHRGFLKKVLALHQAFAAARADDPEGRHSRADGCFAVGLIQYHLGQVKEAESAWRDALGLYRQLAEEFPAQQRYCYRQALSQTNLGGLLRVEGRLVEAEKADHAALALWEQLAEKFPSQSQFREGLARSQYQFAGLLTDLGRLAEAEARYRANLALRELLVKEFPGRADFREHLGFSQYSLGSLLRDLGRLEPAETVCGAALALRKQLLAEFPARPEFAHEVAQSHNSLGNLFRDTGRSKEAEAAFHEALTLQRQLAADFPGRVEFPQALALSLNNLGSLLDASDRLPEAEAAIREALTLRKQLAARAHDVVEFRQDLARSQHSLAVLLEHAHQPKEAEAAYREALAVLKQLAENFPTRFDVRQEFAQCHSYLGSLLRATGRPREAETAHNDALAIRKQLVAEFPDRPDFRYDLAGSHYNLGHARRNDGRPREAEAAYHDAVAIGRKLTADFPHRAAFRQQLARCFHSLGVLLRASRRLPEAESAWGEALALQKPLAAQFPRRLDFRYDLALSQTGLGNVLRDTDRPKQAESAYHDTLVLLKELPAGFPTAQDRHEALARAQNNLAILLHKTSRPKEAESAWRDSQAHWKQLVADFPTVADFSIELASTLANLAVLHYERREFAAAAALLEQARPHQEAALKVGPRNPTYRRLHQNNLRILGMCYLGLAEHARLATTADELARFAYDPANDSYVAACLLCQCVVLADKGSQLTETRRKELTRSYADRALAHLQEAVARGYNNVAEFKTDSNLEPIRGREEFGKLLRVLEGKSKQ
jgi:serine/threonine protein kinase/tetratricopeptide (TPR) repeat protein